MSLKDLERFKFAGTVDNQAEREELGQPLRRTPHTFSSAPRAQFPL